MTLREKFKKKYKMEATFMPIALFGVEVGYMEYVRFLEKSIKNLETQKLYSNKKKKN